MAGNVELRLLCSWEFQLCGRDNRQPEPSCSGRTPCSQAGEISTSVVNELKIPGAVQVCFGKRAMAAVRTDPLRGSASAAVLLEGFRTNNRVLYVASVGSEPCQGLLGMFSLWELVEIFQGL